MENQKKGTGKTVIIVVLILLVLGLGGYITYDKILNKNETKQLEENVKKLNSEITVLKDENTKCIVQKQENTEPSQTNNKYINAVYYGYSENAANNYYPKEFLTLFSDGTFTMIFVDSEGCKGTYEINNDKITIHRDGSSMTMAEDSTYDISSDKTQIKTNDIILKKMN